MKFGFLCHIKYDPCETPKRPQRIGDGHEDSSLHAYHSLIALGSPCQATVSRVVVDGWMGGRETKNEPIFKAATNPEVFYGIRSNDRAID